MPFLLYILYSTSRNTYYVGHTGEEMLERLRKHNSNHKGFTGNVADWKVIYIEKFATKEAAYAREREIKAWKSQKRIEQLIDSEHSA